MKMCKNCINTTNNPSITIDESGLCNVCKDYKDKFDNKKICSKFCSSEKSLVSSLNNK